MIYPMINEGARILEENIAARPSDIDVIWLYGYGWPIYRGGPMFYADLVGLKTIVERLEIYAQSLDEPTLKPTDFLRRLANEGNSFASLNATGKSANLSGALVRSLACSDASSALVSKLLKPGSREQSPIKQHRNTFAIAQHLSIDMDKA